MDLMENIQRNIDWFLDSGVLVNSGLGGAHERVWLLHKDHPLVNKNPLYNDRGIFTYRRPDCAVETALTFAYASKVVNRPGLTDVTQNLLDFVFEYDFQERDPKHKEFGLFAHGLTQEAVEEEALHYGSGVSPYVRVTNGKAYWNKKWPDDNAWVVISSLLLNQIGYDIDQTAITNVSKAILEKKDVLNKYCRGNIDQPHWGGMRVMALGHLYAATNNPEYREEAVRSLQTTFEAVEDFRKRKIEQPFDLSNCGYLVMQLASIEGAMSNRDISNNLETIANYVVSRQYDDGHFPAEWWEGSIGEHIADMVYVQNWANLGLQILAISYPEYRTASEKSFGFLRKIQNKSDSILTNGAWLGAYDTRRDFWGGEDKKEGGPSSIYTGWTNAPILLSFAAHYMEEHPLIAKAK